MSVKYFDVDKFVDSINAASAEKKLKKTRYGFYQVAPLPTSRELEEHYRQKYFKAPAAQIQSKGMDAGIGEEKERYHFDRQYREVASFLNGHFKNKDISILDVGCGAGNFLKALKKEGYSNLRGTEIDPDLALADIKIIAGDYLGIELNEKFDFIMFNNVLEHVPEPEKFIERALGSLNESGVIRFQVPNDLSYSQYRAINAVGKNDYYFYSPFEHLNYFDFSTLRLFLETFGLEIIYQSTYFPMDLFPLMGLGDYTMAGFGRRSHLQRVEFEYSMGDEFLSDFYEKISEVGFGRVVIQYARKK